MNIVKVRFDPDLDGYTAIYIDNKLYKQGDEYHDKMYEKIQGFLEALTYLKVNYSIETFECRNVELNKEICEYADFSLIPDTLDDDFISRL